MPPSDDGSLVIIESVAGSKFLASFASGGEVYANGERAKLPLRRLALRLAPAGNGSEWWSLQQLQSGRFLRMVPPGQQMSWTLQARRAGAARGEVLCSRWRAG